MINANVKLENAICPLGFNVSYNVPCEIVFGDAISAMYAKHITSDIMLKVMVLASNSFMICTGSTYYCNAKKFKNVKALVKNLLTIESNLIKKSDTQTIGRARTEIVKEKLKSLVTNANIDFESTAPNNGVSYINNTDVRFSVNGITCHAAVDAGDNVIIYKFDGMTNIETLAKILNAL